MPLSRKGADPVLKDTLGLASANFRDKRPVLVDAANDDQVECVIGLAAPQTSVIGPKEGISRYLAARSSMGIRENQ